jgi:hypothetical protein
MESAGRVIADPVPQFGGRDATIGPQPSCCTAAV